VLSNPYKSDKINLQKMEKGEIDMKQRYDKKISNTYYPKMAEAQNDGIIFYSLMFPKIAVKSSINQDDKIEIEFINANKIEEIIKEKRKRKKILKIILIGTSILLKNIYVTTAIIFFLAFILEDLKYFIKIVYKIKFSVFKGFVFNINLGIDNIFFLCYYNKCHLTWVSSSAG
jgi:predicted nucleic acid-binding Zn ribbon protein